MDLALVLSLILAAGIAAQWLAWYLKQPSILFLLIVGVIIGPVTGLFNPDEVLGDWLFPFISLGVAIILFEGALTLEFHEIERHGKVVRNLVSIGVVITILLVSVCAYALFDIDYQIALLFGALVSVTGSTVIVPILRSVRPNKSISNILRWEGILIDPVGALAVVLVYEYIVSGEKGESFFVFISSLAVGTIIGFAAAFVLAKLIKRHHIPGYLQTVFTLAFVLLVFSLSNAIEHESGLVTVTVMGLALANWPNFPKAEILNFKESLSVLLISSLFIVLAARIDLSAFLQLGFPVVILLILVMFLVRPLTVFISSFNSKLTLSEKVMLCWIAPRGIVAAAISSLFVLKLASYDLKGTQLLVPLVFVIIVGTVFIQSLGAKAIANKLGVSEPQPNGVFIVGGNEMALIIAESLASNDFSVTVANTNFEIIKKARMLGLNTYYGNPVSEHADRYIDLVGLGSLFAMSSRQETNVLTALKYRHEFGDNNIYRLKIGEKSLNNKQKTSKEWQTPWLFAENITFNNLASLFAQGATVKTTLITADYPLAKYQADNPGHLPLYVVSKKHVLRVFSSATEPKIEAGDKLVSLIKANSDKGKNKQEEIENDNTNEHR